ncbi:MAG: TIGR03032 family protein [Pseudomonadota bacterium]
MEPTLPQGAGQQPAKPVKINCSRGLANWLRTNGVSFGFTSYRTGRLYLIGILNNGKISFHERQFIRAMGVHATPQQIVLASHWQIWRLENVIAPGRVTPEGFDRHYIPRNAQTTGDVDAHDVGVDNQGRIVFVNTKYSCLATFSHTHSFQPIWKPPFISRLAPEDRCHLNGLAMLDGAPKYVTAVCKSDIVNGWRDRRAEGGCVVDVETNEIVTDRLSMPHSPRVYNGELYVLDSGRGELARVDRKTGERSIIGFYPGFLRGLAFYKHYAIIGLSLPREQSFAGLELDDNLKKRDAEPWCGVQIVDLRNGDVVEWLRLEGEVRELFDTFVLPGVRCPMALGLMTPEVQSLITIEAPAQPLSTAS